MQKMDKIQYIFKPLTVGNITDDYVSWLNNPDVNQFLEVRHKKQTQKTVHDYICSFYNQEEKYIWGIYHNGKMIGTANLTDVDRTRKIAGFGLMIGDTNYWGRLASDEAFKFVLNFAFNELGMGSVYAVCADENIGINFAVKKMGFTRESVKNLSHNTPAHQWRIVKENWNN